MNLRPTAILSPWLISSESQGFPQHLSGDKLMVVAIQNLEKFEFGAAAALPIRLNDFAAVGPVARGERFPALKPISGGQSEPQEVIRNWTALLKQ